jgi:hypothetical protein
MLPETQIRRNECPIEIYSIRAANPTTATRPTGAAVWRGPEPGLLVVLGVPSVLVTGAVVVMLVTSVEPPVVMVDSVTKVVEAEAEPLSVTDAESVPELLAVSDVEKIVLVERVVVATDPSLFVTVETISVVEMGITTPPVPVPEPVLSERVVVSTAVVMIEPALSVAVEMMIAVVAAEVSSEVAPGAPVAKTVVPVDVTYEGS